jgi:hypothetical protein
VVPASRFKAALGPLRVTCAPPPTSRCRAAPAVCREIKVAIAFVVSGVAQEDTPGGSWGELMWRSGSRVRVACTTKDAQMLIGGRRTEQGKMRTRSLNCHCGKTV